MAASDGVVLLGGVRSGFGRFGGSLRETPVVALGAAVMNGALDRTGLEKSQVEGLYLGMALIMGGKMVPARQVQVAAGLPLSVPTLTVDRACCSGMSAVGIAYRNLGAGVMQVAVAGGMENMSRTPYLLHEGRFGHKRGDWSMEDLLLLRSPVSDRAIAQYVGEVSLRYGVSREEQDGWAVRSQQRYAAALERGVFAEEILPISATLDGKAVEFARDEQPRPETSLDKLARLKTVSGSPTVTAGNAPGLNDGACALVLASATWARASAQQPLARLLGYVEIAGDPEGSAYLPAVAIQKLLVTLGLNLDAVRLIEINEAFAAMPLVSSLELCGRDAAKAAALREKINVNGGAVAIGHPTGASGARIILTLANELRRRGGGIGLAAICGGFGQTDAVAIAVD